MSKVQFDDKRNLVTVKYSGNVNTTYVQELHLELQTFLPKCRKGFRMLVDLSTVDTMDQGTIPFVKKMMDLCNQYGVSEIIRVIPDTNKDIGFNLLSIFHYDKGVKIRTCQSLEEVND